MIGQAGDGDSLVFTFSGHGSWLPDDDRDEPDARDEMMCPYDVHEGAVSAGRRLERDLLRQARRRPAVRDRGLLPFGFGRAVRARSREPDGAPLKARFLPPYVFARGDRAVRARDRSRGQHAGADEAAYPALLFSGCQDTRVQLRHLVQWPPERRVYADGHRRAAGRRHRLAARTVRRDSKAAALAGASANAAAVREPEAKLGRLF